VSRIGPLLVLAMLPACGGAAPAQPPVPEWSGWTAVAHALDSAIAAGAAPGAVVAVTTRGRHWYHASGRLGEGINRAPDARTLYDLASLTKVIGLTTAMMLAVQEERIALDSPAVHYVAPFTGGGRDRVTIRQLLTHCSGMPAWRPLYRETASRTEAFALADTTPLDTLPGARYLYSDLGAMVLTQAVEAVYGERLDQLLAARVFGPLGMNSTRYLPPERLRSRIAPTEKDPWRGRVLRGEVHDENAARLDGVSGHAGLFSDAEDLLVFADWMLARRSGRAGGPSGLWLQPGIVGEFTRKQELVPGSSRALGWDTPSEGSSAGTRLGPHAFGHTGFTGTSIWLDPDRDLAIILLSNRVNPTRNNPRWGPVRALIADRVVAALEGGLPAGGSAKR
jgi:CubicO group peptidase (beta-lactamase class C family)